MNLASRQVSGLQLFKHLAALLCTVFFLATTFRYGWNRNATDFRNYYTGALLLRKSEPLPNYYDANRFQREMNAAGIKPLGSYIPQTPLAMLPLVPFSRFSIQAAKRIWLLFNLAFLGAAFWMLARLTNLRFSSVALLAFLGYGTLHYNFLFGQDYVLLLFLITGSLFLLEQGAAETKAGALLSIAFALKLYGAPFVLYLGAKRRWRAMLGMLVVAFCFGALAIMLFGWSGMLYFARNILPRALAGETIDPYNSLNNTFSTLLRRTFMLEPELNPNPLWNAPGAFFMLQALLTLLIFAAALLAIINSQDLRRNFALFAVAVLLASANIGSYTYVLALLPVALLFAKASRQQKLFLLICYFLLGLPMNYTWSWFFPKLWLLMALFLFAGYPYWRRVRPAIAIGALCGATALAGVSAKLRLSSYLQEPEHRFEPIAVQEGAVFSSSPAVLRSGIVYQALSRDRYVLRWLHHSRIEEFRFDGHALDPVAESPDGPIRFDLLANRRSTRMLFDPGTGLSVPLKIPNLPGIPC